MARIPNLVGDSLCPNGGILLAGSDGGVFAMRGAEFYGNLVGKPLAAPIVDIVAHGDHGYWLIGADGGIFSFGDAPVVTPYAKFFDEYHAGIHAMRFGEFDGKHLILISDDLHDYSFDVA